METKNSNDFVLKALKCLNYTESLLVAPHSPGGGGLALPWNTNIAIKVLSESQNFIDTTIEAEGRTFFATFIYGEPDKTKRKAIWDKLTERGKDRIDP